MVSDREELKWLDRIEELFPKIEGWFQRTQRVPPVPAARSSLARDDQVYPRLPPSNLAYGSISSASEHLELFRVALSGTKALYPAAYFTLLRTALMGAVSALWVLKPTSRPVRIEHALKLARDDIRQNVNKLMEEPPAEFGIEDQLRTERTRLEQRLVELQAAATAAGIDGDKVPGWRLNMTQMIDAVSELVYTGSPDDAGIRYGVALMWRIQSGHAHATPSAMLNQIDRDRVRPHGTSALAQITASYTDVGMSAVGVAKFLDEAWRLYDLRCQPPP